MLASSHDNVESLPLSSINDNQILTRAFTLEKQKQCLCQQRRRKIALRIYWNY